VVFAQEDVKGNETTNRKRSDSLIEPPGNYHGEVSILLWDIDVLRVVLFVAEQLAKRDMLYDAVNY